VRGVFEHRGPAEETRAQLRIPLDAVPAAHLILKEPRQEQALCACHLHHQAVVMEARVRHEVVEDRAEIRGSRPIAVGGCGHVRIVRQHAGVIQQLVPIDGRLGHVLETQEEELQGLPRI